MLYLRSGRRILQGSQWKKTPPGEKEDINDDVIFEVELIKQIEINIDYILLLVKKYHDSPTAGHLGIKRTEELITRNY